MVPGLWWGWRGTLEAGILYLPSYRDLSGSRHGSRAPVGVVGVREKGETQVVGMGQKVEKSAGHLQQLCWLLASLVVKYA